MMLSEDDTDWLTARYPDLRPTVTGGISGVVAIAATYKSEQNDFLILHPGVEDVLQGIRLDIRFEISIEARTSDSASRLPALRIQGIPIEAGRHISPDGTACLSSPFAETAYLEPVFSFQRYFEDLCIPFLYGQHYFDQKGTWPWDEYSHGSLGILEAYQPAKSPSDVQECLLQLRRDRSSWSRVSAVLKQRGAVSDSIPCICKRHHRMGRCHPRALRGLQQFRRDLRALHMRP
jgi:hypothetical protein